jgi:outer membrane protein assembly factor BamB
VLINDDYCFFNKGQIFKYSSTSRTSTILAHEGRMPESRIYSSSQEIHYTNDKTLVARSKNDGSIIRALVLPAKASGIYMEDQHIFIWIPDRGVQCYQTINYQLLWEYKIEDAHIANMHFEVEDDCLYFSANDVYCLDIPSGQLKWKTEGNCSSYPFYTRVIDGYLIHYNSCFKEGEIPALIEILDAQSGEVKYRGWTSAIYPADDFWGVSEMDMQGYFSFAQNSCGNILVGLRQNTLQGFSIKQK